MVDHSSLFFPLILFLGWRTLNTDLKKGVIKNSDLLLVLAAGVLIFSYLVFLKGVRVVPLHFAGNLCLAAALGLILYFTGAWGAGDAKLLILYSFLLPFPIGPHLLPFSAFVVFSNTIVVLCFSVFILSLVSIRYFFRHGRMKRFFAVFEWRNIYESFFMVFSVSWIIPFSLKRYHASLSPLLYCLLTYGLYTLLHRTLRCFKSRKAIYFFVFPGVVLRFFIYQQSSQVFWMLWRGLKSILIFTVLFSFLDMLFSMYGRVYRDRRLSLAPYMFAGAVLAYTHFLETFMVALNAIRR